MMISMSRWFRCHHALRYHSFQYPMRFSMGSTFHLGFLYFLVFLCLVDLVPLSFLDLITITTNNSTIMFTCRWKLLTATLVITAASGIAWWKRQVPKVASGFIRIVESSTLKRVYQLDKSSLSAWVVLLFSFAFRVSLASYRISLMLTTFL